MPRALTTSRTFSPWSRKTSVSVPVWCDLRLGQCCTRFPRTIFLLGCDDHLQGLLLGRVAECVVGGLDLVQAEVVRDQLLGPQFARHHHLEQHRNLSLI